MAAERRNAGMCFGPGGASRIANYIGVELFMSFSLAFC